MTVRETGTGVLHTRSGSHTLALRTANGFWSRFKGLMLAPPLGTNEGLLLTRCSSVHCAFMRHPIDVVYLDASGKVTQCVPDLKPWRASVSGASKIYGRACHALELAAGSIKRLAIDPGDRFENTHWTGTPKSESCSRWASRDRGSAMTEFVVVGPIISLFGLALIQYGMLFFAKAQINHASFMAARAGSVGNASLAGVQQAYVTALIPLYGGGQTTAELAASLEKANLDLAGHIRIELLNPTKESFDDWSDPTLQTTLGTGSKRVIPNSNQGFKNQEVRSSSGQTIQDANLIKLRITQGYMPKVPIVASIYRVFLAWLDPKTDSFHSSLVEDGRIPLVTSVTLQMQSDAIEGDPVSVPGLGNSGEPVDPGDPLVTESAPPECATISCSSPPRPPADSAPVEPGGPCTDSNCPPCTQAP